MKVAADHLMEVITKLLHAIGAGDREAQLVAKALMEKVRIGATEKPVFNQKTNLTKREVEILQLICKEMTMKEIGDQLFLSEQTVHTHRKNLMKKTQVKNAVGLVKYAIQNRIISI